MKEYKYILLDLDGTITDPMIGITRCVEYALNHFGIQVNDLRELCPFIGPPLLDSFRDFYHFTDEQAKEATEKYRERFADTGIYENKLYDGMKDFLEEATRQGRILMLATSKPTVFAKRILDYFDIARYFTFVAGSGLDGSFYTKGDVLIYQTVSYISANFKKKLSLEEMAKDLGVSKYVLSRLFSKIFHRNFNQYLNDARLNYACHRLENTSDSITNICLDSGFESQRTFNRVFKERYKISPSDYRSICVKDILS